MKFLKIEEGEYSQYSEYWYIVPDSFTYTNLADLIEDDPLRQSIETKYPDRNKAIYSVISRLGLQQIEPNFTVDIDHGPHDNMKWLGQLRGEKEE